MSSDIFKGCGERQTWKKTIISSRGIAHISLPRRPIPAIQLKAENGTMRTAAKIMVQSSHQNPPPSDLNLETHLNITAVTAKVPPVVPRIPMTRLWSRGSIPQIVELMFLVTSDSRIVQLPNTQLSTWLLSFVSVH